MIPSIPSMSSPSSAAVRVDKATSEFLIGPDWTLNIDICDTVNSNQMLAKDVVKAVKKRLQHKNPKVQLLALTLLETMVKNCGDYVHFQIAERNILQEMVKIVKKKTDMHVRDKILTLIGSWHDAFGGAGGRYPQYYMAYEDLRRSGIQFPQHSPDPVPIFTPPATHPVPRLPQPGYGMPSGSSTRLDEAMAAEERLSLSSLNSMREVLDLLADMLKAVDPNDHLAIKDEVIIDLADQCRANQRKLVQSLATIADEELLGQGLELNDDIQRVLARHDAIASGSPLPPEITNVTQGVPEKHDSNVKSAEGTPNTATSTDSSSPSAFPAHKNVIDEEDEEEDDFAQLARRHSKTPVDTSAVQGDVPPSMSNAIVLVSAPATEQSKDQDIIDLLSITLSTPISNEQTSESPTSQTNALPKHIPSTSSGVTYSSEGYPGMAFNGYVAPWAQPQPQPQLNTSYTQPLQQPQMNTSYTQSQLQTQMTTSYTQSQLQPQINASYTQPQPQPQMATSYTQSQPQPQPQVNTSYTEPQVTPEYLHPQQQSQHASLIQGQQESQSRPVMRPPQQPQYHPPRAQTQYPRFNSAAYPPPPWASTPGYSTGQNSASRPQYMYPNVRPTTSPNTVPPHHVSTNSEPQTSSGPRSNSTSAGQKPFIPSYRLFEDLDVFGNTDKRFNTSSASLLGANHQNMVGGRK